MLETTLADAGHQSKVEVLRAKAGGLDRVHGNSVAVHLLVGQETMRRAALALAAVLAAAV